MTCPEPDLLADLLDPNDLPDEANDEPAPAGAGVGPAPFMKWAGGKRQLLGPILAGRPTEFTTYVEPFVGGGAVFFAVPLDGAQCTIADVNPELVNAYQVVRDQTDALVRALEVKAGQRSEAAFYRIRAAAPRTRVARAARAIYLNKTCFNGLWRENAAGQFNVPWGGDRKDPVCNPALLHADAARLAGTNILLGDFETVCAHAQAGTWLYVDPPYIALNATSSFATYSKGGFGTADHERLAETIAACTARGVRVMMSNSDTPLTRSIYGALDLYSVDARRSVGAYRQDKKMVSEILGVNYPLGDMFDAAMFTASAQLVHSGRAAAR